MTDYEELYRKLLLHDIEELFSEIKTLIGTVYEDYNSEEYNLNVCTDLELEEFRKHLGKTACRLDLLAFRYHTSQSWKYKKSYLEDAEEADDAEQ